jgi:hypothetical protein
LSLLGARAKLTLEIAKSSQALAKERKEIFTTRRSVPTAMAIASAKVPL